MRFLPFASALLVGALSTLSAGADVTNPRPGLTLVRHSDSAMVIADLCAAGVSVRATKYEERQATPGQWAQKPAVQADAAINADFFDFPGWTVVVGRARGAGEDWPPGHQYLESRSYWQFGPGLAGFAPDAAVPPAGAPAVTEIVGGHNILILNGQSHAPGFDGDAVITTSHRRTAIGLSADRRFLYLFVTNLSLDGTGLVAQLVQHAAEGGAPPIDVATNEDGGGSSQMFVSGVGDLMATGRQVNNHLGVLAKGSGPATNCPLPPLRDVLLLPEGGGYVLDGHGAIVPGGSAPALPSGGSWDWDIARAFAIRPDHKSGYLLDGWGGVHAVGDAPKPDPPSPYWQGMDIARGLALRPDGESGWVLDGAGGLHAFGGAPEVTIDTSWEGQDEARDVALRADGASGYVLDAHGGIHPFGGAPEVTGAPSFSGPNARSFALGFDGVSGYVLGEAGGIHPFGHAIPIDGAPPTPNGGMGIALASNSVIGVTLDRYFPYLFGVAPTAHAIAVGPDGTSGYVLDGYGVLHAFGGAADLETPPIWPAWDIARDVVVLADGKSGYLLDGWGGLHTFGSAPAFTKAPYWPNSDVARRVVLRSDGKGYLLDAPGAIHSIDDAPAITGGPYFEGQDVARDLALRSDEKSGYLLTADGKLYAVGGAPEIAGYEPPTPFHAHAVALRDDGKSGWVLEGSGALYPFGGAPDVTIEDGPWKDWDVARDVVLTSDDTGFVVDIYGGVHPFAPPPPPGHDGQGAGASGSDPSDLVAAFMGGDDAGAVHGGCACRLGPGSRREAPIAPILLLVPLLAFSIRRRAERRGHR